MNDELVKIVSNHDTSIEIWCALDNTFTIDSSKDLSIQVWVKQHSKM